LAVTVRDLTRGTDWDVPSGFTGRLNLVRRFRRPFDYVPPKDRDFLVRLAAARRRYPELVAQLERAVQSRSDYRRVQRFLMIVSCDSDLEAVFLMLLLAAGAKIGRLSPQSLGFRKHPIVDPATLQVVGHCRFPALVVSLGTLEILFFPQVSLRPLLARKGAAQSQTHTVDGLVAARVGDQVDWLLFEVDGTGHDSAGDADRQEHLDLPTIRLRTTEIVGPEPLAALASALRGALSVASGARC
jgi:hypothetical protein